MNDSDKKELWDVYDENMRATGETFYEGISLPRNRYGYLVHIIIRNKQNEYLLQQRAFTKKWYPGQWDATCGRVQAGETGIEGAVREVKEELGLTTKPSDYTLLYHSIYKNSCLLDIFLLELDFNITDCVIQKEEVECIKLCSFNEMLDILADSKDDTYLDVLKTIDI